MIKPVNSNAWEHIPYSNSINSDSIMLPEDNDPVMSDGTTAFEKPIMDQWINAELNLP